jgi:hypothetical protein
MSDVPEPQAVPVIGENCPSAILFQTAMQNMLVQQKQHMLELQQRLDTLRQQLSWPSTVYPVSQPVTYVSVPSDSPEAGVLQAMATNSEFREATIAKATEILKP